jgi:glyoxylase-like metal-dependent hydrolase (beta-lactamase superfamily II)
VAPSGVGGGPVIRIRRVLAPNPGPFTLEGTNTWILGTGPTIVIDPGPDDAGHLLQVADEAEPVAAVLLTHRHDDHAAGATRLAEAVGAPVYAFRPEAGERPIRHDQAVEADGVSVRAVHTPGHTPDHLAFAVEGEGAMFTGDAVLGRGTSVVDPPDGDMAAYVRSLRELRALAPRVLYPGHGPLVFEAVRRLDEYLAHRAHRESQVVRALDEGKATPEEMVPEIYGEEIPEAMFPVAARSILAHLLKLEREGRAARVGRQGTRFEPILPRACERCGGLAVRGSRYCRRCAMAVLQEGPSGAADG